MTSNDVTPPKRLVHEHTWQTLIEFSLSTEHDSERLAVNRVVEVVQRLNWPVTHLERLKLVLAKATRNALERSRLRDSGVSPLIRVLIPEDSKATEGGGQTSNETVQGQISEKAAQQTGRSLSHGWGFFLVQKQRDNSQEAVGRLHNIIELFLYQENHPSA
jgi:hypothetical protein